MRDLIVKGLAVVLLAVVSVGCSDSDKAIDSPTPPASVDRKVSAIFLDAATSRPVTGTLDVTVRDEAGALSAVAQNAAGQAMNHFSVTNGIAVFAVSRTAPLPFTLQVIATAEGYDPAVARVVMSADGEVEVTARMANRALPPPGAVAVVRPLGSANASGTTADAMTATTLGSVSAPAVSLTVPAATTLLDSAGAPLTGALTARLSYYDTNEPAAFAMLPGNGEALVAGQSGQFVSAGFASVEIADASGRRAATSSAALPLRINVSPVADPSTGAVVGNGSMLPAWSYSADTGRWRSDGTANVTRDAQDRLEVLAQPNHFSFFNFGWLCSSACTAPTTVLVSGNPNNLRLTALATLVNGGWARLYSSADSNPNQFVLKDAIPQRATRISIRLDGVQVGETVVQDPCAGGQVTVPVNVPVVQPADLVVRVARVCEEDTSKRTSVGKSATVVVAPLGSLVLPLFDSTDANGEVTFRGLRAGLTYRVYTYVFGIDEYQVASKTLVPGQNVLDVTLPTTCEGTGATGASGGTR
ncbi:MAG TPA: hypothetical protein VFK85_13040 [Anaeromyxobacteraceae bacterium]|nr:hypothetical protein [Anaeromyxobacteraceae bacterium]